LEGFWLLNGFYWNFLKTLSLTIPQTKANIFKIRDGVDFVGYKIHPGFIRLRKSNIKKFIKRTKKLKRLFLMKDIAEINIVSSIQSWLGYSSHADGYKICRLVMQKSAQEFIGLFLHRYKRSL